MLLFPLIALVSTTVVAAKCSVVVDARFPKASTGADVDAGKLPFNNAYDLGENQTWAEVLKFPKTSRSLFDNKKYKSVEVTLSDGSIFAPSSDNVQRGFRRSELLPQPSSATAAVSGVKTWHLSLQRDENRPLNYSHEYYLFCRLVR
jgi:hypothetical protein